MTELVTEEFLRTADWVSAMSVAAGVAVKYVSREFPNGYREGGRDRVKGRLMETTTPHLENVREVLGAKLSPCTVDGRPVDELAILIKPTANLVTTQNGTPEITRCYFQNGEFRFGVDIKRLGGIGARAVEYFPERGLYIHFEHNYEMFVPTGHCQATWRLPESA